MNAAIVVMTILGCGQGEAACEYIRTVEQPFVSRAECEARMEAELMKTGSAGYPDVIAVCEPPHAIAGAPPVEDGAPKVVMMPEEAKPRGPLRWAAETTRRFVGATRKMVTRAWRGLTDGLASRRERDPEPLLRYAAEQ